MSANGPFLDKDGLAYFYSKLKDTLLAKNVNYYGFKIDKSQTDPAKAVIYTNGAVGMTPAHMDFTNEQFDYGSWGNAWFITNAYPVALNFDGTEAYRLDPSDYSKKVNGEDSDIYDETKNLNFMMAFPKVYFRRYEDNEFNYVEVSDRRLTPEFKAYAHINVYGQEMDYIYLPLFKGSIIDGKLRSISGANPTSGTNATTELNAAQALGSRWQFWDHSAREMICDLLTLISRNTDSQSAFGKGQESGYDASDTVAYGMLQTGTLVDKGLFFGYSSSLSEVKCFGMEGLWGNRWDRVLGMLLVNGVWNIKMTPDYNFTGANYTILDTPPPTTNNYLRTISTSEYGSIPATVSDHDSSPFKDYFYQNRSGTRVALAGGSCGDGTVCGFRYVNVSDAASSSRLTFGASPVYK